MKNGGETTNSEFSGLQFVGNEGLLETEFSDLVAHASSGDRRAIGAIAIAFGPSLLVEAQDALGEFRGEADGVFRDFLNVLTERRSPFNAQRDGCPLRWMDRIVRSIAQQRRFTAGLSARAR